MSLLPPFFSLLFFFFLFTFFDGDKKENCQFRAPCRARVSRTLIAIDKFLG